MKHTQKTFVVLCLAIAATSRGQAPPDTDTEPPGDPLELARAHLDQHYQLQELIAKEDADWETGKKLLESRIDLLRDQIKDTDEQTKTQAKEITESDESSAKLVEEDKALSEVVESQYEQVEQLETRLRRIIPLLPNDLLNDIQPVIDRLPAEGKKRDEIKANVSERYVNVLAILKKVGSFHGSITLTVESRKMSDGKIANVDTLYLGLAQAYYIGTGDRVDEAGIGAPGKDGWQWTPTPDDSKTIARIIGMYKGEEDAAFVPLPVSINGVEPSTGEAP